MITSYVEEKHKSWDKYLPEFRFALNSAVHESTGVTPQELNLSCPRSPQLCDPDAPPYTTATRIAELQRLVKGNLEKAKCRLVTSGYTLTLIPKLTNHFGLACTMVERSMLGHQESRPSKL